ncbi:MAG: hydantoinase/oxoprolinase N-terminal domain-containing protein, partial [bacterium]
MSPEVLAGVDIGGTFTDMTALVDGKLVTKKVPTTSEHPEQGVRQVLNSLTEQPHQFFHSTTLVTNMILEHKGAKTGWITSEGMRDVLHIGRHKRPLNYSVQQEIPRQDHPPVPRSRRKTVPERIDANGEIVTPLDESKLRQVTHELVDDNVEAIGIGFLHAYKFPEHEIRAREIVEQEAPETFVC